MSKLYAVNVEITMMVMADTEAKAEQIARENVEDEIGLAAYWAHEVKGPGGLDHDELNAIPWGSTDERTVQDLLKEKAEAPR